MLTDANKKYIKENWDKVALIDIVRHVGEDPLLDGRSELGKEIKEYITKECGGEVKTTKWVNKEFVLTDSQKEFVKNNAEACEYKAFEMAKMLFPDKPIFPLNKEVSVIHEYLKTIKPEGVDLDSEYAEKEYRPPISVPQVIFRLKSFVPEYTLGKLKLPDPKTLSEIEKKKITALLGYMNTDRFKMQINSYSRKNDRILFESCFVRYTHDKEDLAPEDVDQYIIVADEIVAQSRIQKIIDQLDEKINEILSEEDGEKKIPTNLVELINKQQEKLNASRGRSESLLKTLTGARSKRLESREQENASVLNLVEAWQHEKTRLKLIEIAKQQKEAEIKEVDELSNMDSVIALVVGMSKERAKH